MSKVQARYNGDPAIHLRHFDTVESMRAALTRDLNQTSEQLCGTYLGMHRLNGGVTSRSFAYISGTPEHFLLPSLGLISCYFRWNSL